MDNTPDNKDNVKETIEFEPVLNTDFIESQLDLLRTKISELFTGPLTDPINSVTNVINTTTAPLPNAGDKLLETSQEIINSFITAPELISKDLAYFSFAAPFKDVHLSKLKEDLMDSGFMSLFDPNYSQLAPYTYTDYRSGINKKLSEGIGEFFSDNAGTMIGLAAGALFPFTSLGIASSVALGFASDAIIGAGAEKEKGIRELTGKFKDMFSTYSRVSLGKHDLEALSEQIYSAGDSFYAKLYDITPAELITNIETFAQKGGFRNIRSSGELKDTITDIIENTRELSHTLGMFQDEVLGIMADLKMKGISSTTEAKDLLINLNNQASLNNVSFSSLIDYGTKSASLLRSFGYSPKGGFNMGVETMLDVNEMFNEDPMLRQAIIRQGGVPGTVTNILHTLPAMTQQYATPLLYNALLNRNLSLDPYNNIESYSDYMSTYGVEGILASRGLEREVFNNLSIRDQARLQVQRTMSTLDILNLGNNDEGKLNKDVIIGMMVQQNPGLTRDQAEIFLNLGTSSNEVINTLSSSRFNFVNRFKDNDPSIFKYISAGASSLIDSVTEPFVNLGRNISKAFYSVGDVATDIFDYFTNVERIEYSDLSGADMDLLKSGFLKTIDKRITESEDYKQAESALLQAKSKIGDFNIDLLPSNLSDLYKLSSEENILASKYFYKYNYGSDNIKDLLSGATSVQDVYNIISEEIKTYGFTGDVRELTSKIIASDKDIINKIKNFEEINDYRNAITDIQKTFTSQRKEIEKTYFDKIKSKLTGESGKTLFNQIAEDFISKDILINTDDIINDVEATLNEYGNITNDDIFYIIKDNISKLSDVNNISTVSENDIFEVVKQFKKYVGAEEFNKESVLALTSRISNELKEDYEGKLSESALLTLQNAAPEILRYMTTSKKDFTITSSEGELKDILDKLTFGEAFNFSSYKVAVGEDKKSSELAELINMGNFFQEKNINLKELTPTETLQAEYYNKFLRAFINTNRGPALATVTFRGIGRKIFDHDDK